MDDLTATFIGDDLSVAALVPVASDIHGLEDARPIGSAPGA